MNANFVSQADRVLARCRKIAACTDVPGGTTRLFLSPAAGEVHRLLRGWMEAAGMAVHVDAAGNLRGLLQPAHLSPESTPRLLIGSHLDTVPDAGAFDGVLGVVLALALVEMLHEQIQQQAPGEPAAPLPFAIEIVGFSEEEGVRFARPFLGSLALIGALSPDALACTDAQGVSVADAIRAFGLDPSGLSASAAGALAHPSTFAFLEFHIEQGPVLESRGLALAVVDAIVGQSRLALAFAGHANHAGTTPMGELRHDALAAAAAWVVEVERYARSVPGLVATVGKLEVAPGAANVVPGRCAATLDVRHARDTVRAAAVEHLVAAAQTEAHLRGVSLTHAPTLEQQAVPMDTTLRALLEAAVAATTPGHTTLSSGAGHDAMVVVRRIPSAMLFLRSPGGLSHHPAESVLAEDVQAAIAAGLEFFRRLREDNAMLECLIDRARAAARDAAHA